MPIYEFECPDCGASFEALVRSAQAAREVACPGCGGDRAQKRVSTFAARVGGGAACAPSG